MQKKINQKNKYVIAYLLNQIGNQYYGLEDYNNALKFYNESLMIAKLYLCIENYISISLNNIGNAYYGLNEYNNAIKFFNESLEINRKLYHENHNEKNNSL